MGFDVHISGILCERCGWTMRTYAGGDFYCPNEKCERVFTPFELRMEMHRKETASHAC